MRRIKFSNKYENKNKKLHLVSNKTLLTRELNNLFLSNMFKVNL
jgi:sulfatase maturation enzyme AslB (radical SAM superfamily)